MLTTMGWPEPSAPDDPWETVTVEDVETAHAFVFALARAGIPVIVEDEETFPESTFAIQVHRDRMISACAVLQIEVPAAANARAALPVPALDALTYERAWMDLMDEARAFEAWYLPTRMGVNAWVGVDTTSGFYGGWSIEGDPLYDDWDESVMTTASGATPEAVIADLIGIARDYRARRDAEYAALGEDVK